MRYSLFLIVIRYHDSLFVNRYLFFILVLLAIRSWLFVVRGALFIILFVIRYCYFFTPYGYWLSLNNNHF